MDEIKLQLFVFLEIDCVHLMLASIPTLEDSLDANDFLDFECCLCGHGPFMEFQFDHINNANTSITKTSVDLCDQFCKMQTFIDVLLIFSR